MTTILNLLLVIFFLGFLLFGLLQSKKHSFRAGFYCFLILIINQMYLYIAPYTTHRIVDIFVLNDTEPPFGMRLGELVHIFSLIPRILEALAISILIVGLYKIWNSKET